MYCIANFSVVSLENLPKFSDDPQLNEVCQVSAGSDRLIEQVFCQADLWKVHKQIRTIHVTDRFPRTWE